MSVFVCNLNFGLVSLCVVFRAFERLLISIFDETELELLISGLPTIDIEDLRKNTDYVNCTIGSQNIIWFWEALRAFTEEEKAKFLQFVTGTSKVPLEGFKMLKGMRGITKFNIHKVGGGPKRLPSAHTWSVVR